MAEEQFKVNPVGVKYICDDCGKGELIYKHMDHTNGVYVYTHECPSCNHLFAMNEKFPTVRFIANTIDTHG